MKQGTGASWPSASLSTIWATTTTPCASMRAALIIARAMGDRILEGNALNNIGILYFVWGEHDLALEYYLDNLAIQLEMENPAAPRGATTTSPGSSRRPGDTRRPSQNYRQALQLYRELDEVTFEASTLNNIGLVLYDMGDFAQALDSLEAALALERATGDRVGEALSLTNMGRISADQGRHAEARGLLRGGSWTSGARSATARGSRSASSCWGRCWWQEGRPDEGVALLEAALELAEELGVQELISDDLLALSKAHESLGRYDLALDYYRRYKETRDIIFDEEKSADHGRRRR